MLYYNGKIIQTIHKGNNKLGAAYFKTKKMYPSNIIDYTIVDDISSYSERKYSTVYSKANNAWYKLNDINEYEEYGVYKQVTSLDKYTRGQTTISYTDGVTYDLNNSWQPSTYWSKDGYSCFESCPLAPNVVRYSIKSMKVIIPVGVSTVTIYFGSDGESVGDYTCITALDTDYMNGDGVIAKSYNDQQRQIPYTYNISDTSKEHYFEVCYINDGYIGITPMTNKGYVLLKLAKKTETKHYTGTTRYDGKLVMYNEHEYEWTGSEWKDLGALQQPQQINIGSTVSKSQIGELACDIDKLNFGERYIVIGYVDDNKSYLNNDNISKLQFLTVDDTKNIIVKSTIPENTDDISNYVWKLTFNKPSPAYTSNSYCIQNVKTGKYIYYYEYNKEEQKCYFTVTNEHDPWKLDVFYINYKENNDNCFNFYWNIVMGNLYFDDGTTTLKNATRFFIRFVGKYRPKSYKYIEEPDTDKNI